MEQKKKLVIKQYALNQLSEHFNYYKTNYSLRYAKSFSEEFIDVVENILPNYNRFPECRFLTTKNKIYRNIVWKKFLIVFKIQDDSIEILSLFHAKQNPVRLKKLRRVT